MFLSGARGAQSHWIQCPRCGMVAAEVVWPPWPAYRHPYGGIVRRTRCEADELVNRCPMCNESRK